MTGIGKAYAMMCRLRQASQAVGPPPAVVVLAVCLALWSVSCGGTAWALGTPAGTVISNSAVVTYTPANATEAVTLAATASFEVLAIIDTVVTWQDATDRMVNTPQSEAVLTFLLTNTGNGPGTFRLETPGEPAGDDFNPLVQGLWLETNGQAGLQTGGALPDTFYQNGSNDPALAADGSQVIYLLSAIPGDLSDGARGRVRLVAAATTPGAADAAPGTELAGLGPGGINAVVGGTRAVGRAEGWYRVAAVDVVLTKSITAVIDPFGGEQPYPGARVTYRIHVAIFGSGAVQELVISDPLPDELAYLAGSITLDGLAQSDGDDRPVDFCDYNVTAAHAVTVHLGDVEAPATRIIEFTTTIN